MPSNLPTTIQTTNTNTNKRFFNWVFESNNMERSSILGESYFEEYDREKVDDIALRLSLQCVIRDSILCRASSHVTISSKTSTSITSSTATFIDHLFMKFKDMTIRASLNDLSKLYISLMDKNTKEFLILNVNAFGWRFEDMNWGIGATKMKSLPNAGGGSLLSEVFSCEIMERILRVELLKTE
ncbi:2341_t:CDS:2, partial [Acaulospora morrowiae]